MNFMSKKGLGTFIAGAAIGAGIALLLAPQDGKTTRAQLKKKLDEIIDNAKDIDIKEKARELKEEIQNLDREKVAKIAKEKGKVIVKKADELAVLAKAKAEPAIEKATKEVKVKTRDVLRAAADKLDDEAVEKVVEKKASKSKKSTK